MLDELDNYSFEPGAARDFPDQIKDEIAHGVADLRRIRQMRVRFLVRAPERQLHRRAVTAEDAIERDQSVWHLATHSTRDPIPTLMSSIESAPTAALATSAVLALSKVAHRDPARVISFLRHHALDADVEVAEWARLVANELRSNLDGDLTSLLEPCSERAFVYEPGRTFDATMPLVFVCHAYTKLGPTTWHTLISPHWFARVFGDAKALVRQETFHERLVLEKTVPDLHPDGSPHYEHFPFSGTTTAATAGVYRHNYWAELYRPFYPSGKTERVTPDAPAVRGIPMTFHRAAMTVCPRRYWVDAAPIPESVRGIFFGYGHVDPRTLMVNRLDIGSGEFQLCPKRNPATGKPANTYFFGTFYGKLRDVDGDGKLDVNTLPVHCDKDGRLDYAGDGSMLPDPVQPLDWTGSPVAAQL
jgi:hypothetical protein